MSPGFDTRQISGSPWATLGLTMDMYRQNAILQRSYWHPAYSLDTDSTMLFTPTMRDTSLDFLLDIRYAYAKTMYNMQTEPWKFMPSYGYAGGYTGGYVGGAGSYPIPSMQFPWAQPAKQETQEEKDKREAKEQDSKTKEAIKATKLKELVDSYIKLATENNNPYGLPFDQTLVTQAEDAMKKDTGAERLAAMEKVMEQVPQEYWAKMIYSKPDVKKKLIEIGFNYSDKVFKEANLYFESNSNGQIDWRDPKQIQDRLYPAINKSSSQYSTDKGMTLKTCASAVSKDTILTVLSNWNDLYNDETNKGLFGFIAHNLPVLPTDANDVARKSVADNYVQSIEKISNALVNKGKDWTSEGRNKYPKLNADIEAVEEALKKVTENSPQNLTQTKVTELSDAFNKLYARLRLMEATRVNQYILNTYKDYKNIGGEEDILNEESVIKETGEDLTSEGIDKPEELDEIEKPAELLHQERIRINGFGDITSENIENIISEGLLSKVPDKENWYMAHTLYAKADGTVLTKEEYDSLNTSEKEGAFVFTKYYVMQDDKLVEAVKNEDGDLIPDSTKQVKTEQVQDFNTKVEKVQSLISAGKLRLLSNIDGEPIPAGEMLLQQAYVPEGETPKYYVWKDGALKKIKLDIKEVYKNDEDGTIRFKIGDEADPTKHLTFAELIAKDSSSFELMDENELKSEEEITEEREAQQREQQQRDEEEASRPLRELEERAFGSIRELNANTLAELPIPLEETDVKGWYKSKEPLVGEDGQPVQRELFSSRCFNNMFGALGSIMNTNTYQYFKLEFGDDGKYHLKRVEDAVHVYSDGQYKDKEGNYQDCAQVGKPEDFAKELMDAIEGDTDEEEELQAQRALNTLLAYDKPEDVLSFLTYYYDNKGWNKDYLCLQLFREGSIFSSSCFEDKVNYHDTEMHRSAYYGVRIAEKLVDILQKEEYKDLATDDEFNTLKDYISDFQLNGTDQKICVEDERAERIFMHKMDFIIRSITQKFKTKQGELETARVLNLNA